MTSRYVVLNKGYVYRVRDPQDGRCFNVHLTQKGREVIRRAYDRHVENLERVAGILTDHEREELVRLLKKIGLNAQRWALSKHGKYQIYQAK